MVPPSIEGIGVFKIASRSISGMFGCKMSAAFVSGNYSATGQRFPVQKWRKQLLKIGAVKAHSVKVLCFLVLLAKNIALSGSFWQSKAANFLDFV